MRIAIGVDIGGSHIVSCGVDLDSKQLIKGSRRELPVNSKANKLTIFRTWANVINATIETIKGASIEGIGCAMPGPFNYKSGVGHFENNDKYKDLCGINVHHQLPKYLSLDSPRLRFINDATAFGIGSALLEEGLADRRLVAITLGTGLGAAFIDQGFPVVRGNHVPKHGALWHLPYLDGVADDYFSTRWFIKTYEEHTGQPVVGVKELARSIDQNPVNREIFEQFARQLAEFIQPWLSKFDADALVIGGNISRAWNLMDLSFREAYPCTRIPEIRVSSFMENAALLGSARLMDETFYSQIFDDLPSK